jgi:hypothetical protein
MTREQFLEMPNDLKAVYIKAIRNKYGPPDSVIAKAMGFSQQAFSQNVIKRLGLANGKTRGGLTKWDKEGFYAWANGVDQLPTPVPEEPIQEPVITSEEPESFVEDDLPFDIVPAEEPEPELDELRMEISLLNAQVDALQKANDALMASHENDCQALEKWRLTCIEYEEKVKVLEAQMDVVRMIFGGANR